MDINIPEIEGLRKRIEFQTNLIEFFLSKSCASKRVVNIQDIARLEGVSISQLRQGGSERYLLPRFGESAFPTGRPRWSIDEYLEWSKKDPKEREAAYRLHLREELRRKLEERDGR